MELISPDMLRSELIGGGVRVPGKLGDIADIAVDSVGGEVANLHVFEHASASRGYRTDDLHEVTSCVCRDDKDGAARGRRH